MNPMHWTQRAQPHLGTLVVVTLGGEVDTAQARPAGEIDLETAFNAAFQTIAHIGHVMSAHDPRSDLGRLARAAPGSVLTLDPHTVRVLTLARHWHGLSAGAFNPIAAAQRLAKQGLRPAFEGSAQPSLNHWHGLHLLNTTQVKLDGPLWLDLGGIAKGYAVDQAIAVLRAQGVQNALVNAGGDLRALGSQAWPIEARHTGAQQGGHRTQTSLRLTNQAMATSDRHGHGTAFVPTRQRVGHPRHSAWSSCSARAPDCVTADALTKWGLQAAPDSLQLQRALRQAGACLWRSP